MKARLINIKDHIKGHDALGGIRGEVIFGTGRHFVDYTDPYGHKCKRTEFDKILYREHNIIPIGGYQFVFDKLFNIGLDQETTLRVGNLNDEAPQMKIGVARADYMSNKYNAETNIGGETVPTLGGINISANNFIFGFMIGEGGAKEDNITAIAPDYKNRGLYSPIPFRMSNDGYDFPEGIYFGKSKTSGSTEITSYYIKKFDVPEPHIVHVWASDNPNEMEIVDDTVFSSTSSIPIESYVEINMSLSEADGRGFFTQNGTSPRVNEFALVSGWYNPELDDYECLQLFSHFTRSSLPMAEGDSLQCVYRLYAR